MVLCHTHIHKSARMCVNIIVFLLTTCHAKKQTNVIIYCYITSVLEMFHMNIIVTWYKRISDYAKNNLTHMLDNHKIIN